MIADGQRIVLQPGGSGVALLRDGVVVAWAGGGTGASAAQGPVPLPLVAGTSHPAQVVPDSLPLVGCDGSPLPPGRYAVQAVVGYGGDPLNQGAGGGGAGGVPRVAGAPAGRAAAAGGGFQLVSGPVTVLVG